MKLWIDNIGIVKDSEIEINGMTVITGYNNSGKTTVGKVLYSLISAVENLRESALRDKVNYAKEKLSGVLNDLRWWVIVIHDDEESELELHEIEAMNDIIKVMQIVGETKGLKLCLDELISHLKKLKVLLETREKMQNMGEITRKFNEYYEIINNISKTILQDEELVEYANAKIDNTLKQEFNYQILPVGSENVIGKVCLSDESKMIFNVEIEHNEVIRKKETYIPICEKEILFIDNVFILDELAEKNKKSTASGFQTVSLSKTTKKEFLSAIPGKGHNNKLTKELLHKDQNLFQDILNKKAAKEIFDKLNTVFDDEVTISDGEVICAKSKIDIRNLAMGAKMFAMLKTLLENGSIKENTVLILDEPEVHLHPEWQNILAELLVLLQHQMGVTILLTTHSPQFLMAIETFAKKYQINEKFKVYATMKNAQDKFVTYQDVTDSLKEAYYRLSKPMFDMKSVKDELEN